MRNNINYYFVIVNSIPKTFQSITSMLTGQLRESCILCLVVNKLFKTGLNIDSKMCPCIKSILYRNVQTRMTTQAPLSNVTKFSEIVEFNIKFCAHLRCYIITVFVCTSTKFTAISIRTV